MARRWWLVPLTNSSNDRSLGLDFPLLVRLCFGPAESTSFLAADDDDDDAATGAASFFEDSDPPGVVVVDDDTDDEKELDAGIPMIGAEFEMITDVDDFFLRSG